MDSSAHFTERNQRNAKSSREDPKERETILVVMHMDLGEGAAMNLQFDSGFGCTFHLKDSKK